jgi:hypothetical protein
MHQWYVTTAAGLLLNDESQKATHDAVMSLIIDRFSWGAFLNPGGVLLANYVPDRFAWVFRTVSQVVDTDDTGHQSLPQDLEDVDRSPDICSEEVSMADSTPDIECTICGDALEASEYVKVMQVSCITGHLYHYNFLEGLINGIETYANRCPNWRAVISKPRPSRPVIKNDD